mmetsp:Transcript_10049/g.15324  ORF Transcript_10049/g.15324 Transcript_10049/m.15324 type:complete len:101 (-) Transcript_10049:701-1003(-)
MVLFLTSMSESLRAPNMSLYCWSSSSCKAMMRVDKVCILKNIYVKMEFKKVKAEMAKAIEQTVINKGSPSATSTESDVFTEKATTCKNTRIINRLRCTSC